MICGPAALGDLPAGLKAMQVVACACDWCLRLLHRRLVAEFRTLKHNMVQAIVQHALGDGADFTCFSFGVFGV
jgi:hypothetical protein